MKDACNPIFHVLDLVSLGECRLTDLNVTPSSGTTRVSGPSLHLSDIEGQLETQPSATMALTVENLGLDEHLPEPPLDAMIK